jgi:hypothetical protein
MKLFSILLVVVCGFAVSCERHDFEGPNGTKQLNEHHAAGGEPTASEHGAAASEHAKPAEPVEKAEH